ncbi:hypothetical protein HMN09_00029100 [Mycena chlorophos]|uniref:Methyltransferase domain-containing protein n=1 Tax=Mycena chlorophos TaxID=658473 RepID=A0A8H6TSH1_MYCCL|nr:hypothetical protein HMN09_00029100 [Mycena chlorophos]
MSTPAPIEHAARDHQQFPGAQYVLPADDPERLRLNKQHGMIKHSFGGKILFAPVSLTKDDKVLESGTGSGAWLLDLASLSDSAVEMTGVDIESRIFPNEPPSNLTFQVGSVLELPADWSNKFTLVHQRLLMAALQVPQWPQALGEIHRVLKSGGYVQIAEATQWAYPPWPKMEKLLSMTRILMKHRNIYLNVANDMPDLLKNAGFVDIQRETRITKIGKGVEGEHTKLLKGNILGVYRGLKTPILKAGGFGVVSSEEEYDTLLSDIEAEWDDMPVSEQAFNIFWARKE